MALSHSPKIVTDGLALYYDMENTQKSWKGKPTTNLINTLLTSYTNDNGCIVETRPETLNGNPIYRVTFPAGTLPRIYTTFAYTAQQYIGSIYYRVISQGSHTPALYFREAGFGTSYTSFALTSKSWALATVNYTFATSGTAMFLLYQSNSAATTPSIIEFSMPQAEVGTFATPYVADTRSNTQSILDLTGQNTITATSLTYGSDGSFSFSPASDNYCSVTAGTSLSNLQGSSAITVEAWVYYNSYSGGTEAYSVITCWGSPWVWLLENSSNILRFRITAGGSDVNIADTTTHSLNTWIHVVGTYDGTTKKIYVNGVLKNSSASTGILASPGGTPKIGTYQGTNYNMDGKISIIKVYNRALSAAEVQQNFNATRSRYGL